MNDYHEYRNIKNQYIKAEIKSLHRSLNSKTQKVLLPSIGKAFYSESPQQKNQTIPSQQIFQLKARKHKDTSNIELLKRHNFRQTLQIRKAQKKELQQINRRDLIKSKIKRNIEKKIQHLLKNSSIRDTLGAKYEHRKYVNRVSLQQTQAKNSLINIIVHHRTPQHDKSQTFVKTPKKAVNKIPDIQTLMAQTQNKKNSVIGRRKSIVTRNLKHTQLSPNQKALYLKQEKKTYSKGRTKARFKKIISQSENHINLQKINPRSSEVGRIESQVTLKRKKRNNYSSIYKRKTIQIQQEPDAQIQPWDLQNKLQSNQFYT